MPQPIVTYESAPFNGPFSLYCVLFDKIIAPPYEGVWLPTKFLKYAQLELEGSQSTLSVDLYGTNLDSVGNVNQYVVTIAGSETTNDVVTLTFKSAQLAGGQEAVAYTVLGGDTATTVAAALVLLINADSKLQGLGIQATNLAGVITVTFPSIIPNPIQANTSYVPSSPEYMNNLTITGASNGSASETIAVACGTNGTKIGASITAFGFTALTMPMRYFKARLNTLTGTSAFVNGALQGVG